MEAKVAEHKADEDGAGKPGSAAAAAAAAAAAGPRGGSAGGGSGGAATEFADVDLSLHAALEPLVSVSFDEEDVASHYKRGAPCFVPEAQEREPVVQLRSEGALLFFATGGGRLKGWHPGQGMAAHELDVMRPVAKSDDGAAGDDGDGDDDEAEAGGDGDAAKVELSRVQVSSFDVSTGRVVVGSADGFAGVWSLQQSTPTATWHDHTARVSSAQWVSGQVYSTGFDGQFLVRNLDQEKVVTSYSSCACPLSGMVVHDPNVVLLSSWDGSVRMLDLRERQMVHAFELGDPVRCVTLEDDVLYASHGVGGVRSFDLRTRSVMVDSYAGSDTVVNALAVSENRLFTGDDDGTVRVFDVVRGTCLDALSGHSGSVSALAVQDSLLFSASHDGTLREYDVAAVEAAIDNRRRRLDEGRRLSQELWLKQREEAKSRKKKGKGKGKGKGKKK